MKASPTILESILLHFRFDRGSIAPRSRLDRAAITSRLRSSSTSSLHRPMVILSDGRSRFVNPVRRDRASIPPFDEDPTLQKRPRGVRYALRSPHLSDFFRARVLMKIAWTPVHAITAVEPESDDRRAATRPAKGKPCGT